MPIKLDCPRCKNPLSIPTGKAGSYVNCPRCRGQFWVPDAVDRAAAESSPTEAPAQAAASAQAARNAESGAAPPTATPPGLAPSPSGRNVATFIVPNAPASPVPGGGSAGQASSPPAAAGAASARTVGSAPVAKPPTVLAGVVDGGKPLAVAPSANRGGAAGAAPPSSSWSTVAPQVQPAVLPVSAPRPPEPGGAEPGRLAAVSAPGAVAPPVGRRGKPPKAGPKVAKFITMEAAQSSLKLAEDGKLPELHLREPGDAAAKDPSATGTNPLVIFGLLCLSIVMSLALVLVSTESREGVSSRKKEEARKSIERDYFSDMDSLTSEPRKEYHVTLREAQQARARNDFKRERELYRDVLRKLRAERGPFDRGVTGSQQRDRTLEELIETLLAGGS